MFSTKNPDDTLYIRPIRPIIQKEFNAQSIKLFIFIIVFS